MCEDCYLSKTVKGFTIEIGVDEDHESPREDHTLGVLLLHGAAQRRWYASDFGTEDYRKRLDGAIAARQNVGRGQADFIRYLRNFERSKVILPVVMTPDYDFAIGTGQQPRGTQWLGYLFDTADSRDLTRTGASSKADIEEELQRELAAYNHWQNNPCYQYMLYAPLTPSSTPTASTAPAASAVPRTHCGRPSGRCARNCATRRRCARRSTACTRSGSARPRSEHHLSRVRGALGLHHEPLPAPPAAATARPQPIHERNHHAQRSQAD
jgi:hypothetical protein